MSNSKINSTINIPVLWMDREVYKRLGFIHNDEDGYGGAWEYKHNGFCIEIDCSGVVRMNRVFKGGQENEGVIQYVTNEYDLETLVLWTTEDGELPKF